MNDTGHRGARPDRVIEIEGVIGIEPTWPARLAALPAGFSSPRVAGVCFSCARLGAPGRQRPAGGGFAGRGHPGTPESERTQRARGWSAQGFGRDQVYGTGTATL